MEKELQIEKARNISKGGLGKGRKEKEFRNGKGNSEITSGKAFPVFEEAEKLRRLRGLAAAAAVLATGFMCLADTT